MTSLEILKKLISYPSITPNECGIYEFIQHQLPDFEARLIEKEGVKNLFLFKHFGDLTQKALHFCFAGHVDVVPPGEGWKTNPFIPEIKEGYIYGRGTQDMKSGISAFLSALQDFVSLQECSEHLIISILLTSDEEGAGTYGTKIVLEELKQKDFLPDIALVGEPTCVHKMGDMIKIGRRGSVNGVINIKGVQGHVAYPEKCINPIELLGSRLGQLAGINLDDGDDNFAPSKLVITDIRGGIEVVNVTPSNVKIMFNVRNSTQTDLEKIKAYVENVLNGLEYELNLTQSSHPFLTDSSSFLAKKLKSIVSEICLINPVLRTDGGTSDARHFASYGVEVVEFGVLNDRIHSVDERVEIKDLDILYKVFFKLLFSLCKEKR